MDIIIRDYNGNTVGRVDDVLGPMALACDAQAQITSDGWHVILTVAAVPRMLDDEEAEAERMTADDMRAVPDWNL